MWKVWIRFEPRDWWIGFYVAHWHEWRKRVYVCIIPLFPIVFDWDANR